MEQKCYSKQELALEYFPDATPEVASAHLRRWINRCKPLHDALVKSATPNGRRNSVRYR